MVGRAESLRGGWASIRMPVVKVEGRTNPALAKLVIRAKQTQKWFAAVHSSQFRPLL